RGLRRHSFMRSGRTARVLLSLFSGEVDFPRSICAHRQLHFTKAGHARRPACPDGRSYWSAKVNHASESINGSAVPRKPTLLSAFTPQMESVPCQASNSGGVTWEPAPLSLLARNV